MLKEIKIGDKIGPDFIVVDIYGGEGKSGMGVVYVCLEPEYEYIFALKTFQDQFIFSNEMKEYFKQEALAWIHLEKHPNIITAATFDIIDERPFIYLELVLPDIKNRKTLEDYLGSGLSTLQILDWAIQFCYGMEHAVSRGVTPHRDIKPANIMIKENILKITDFGLSRLKDYNGFFKTNENIHQLNTECILSGTREYMAPENFSGHADIKSDIYSFGIVLFQMANKGQLPFYAEDDYGWKEAHQNAKIQLLDSKIFPILQKCLNKDPNFRYSDFTELRNDLERLYVKESGQKPYFPITNELEAEERSNKGYGFEKLGYDELAIQEYKDASEIDPNSYLIRMNFGRTLMKIDRSDAAIEELETAVRLKPDSARAHYNLGNAYNNCNCIDEAISEYKQALKLNNRYKEVYNNYGNLIRDEGRIKESIICYNKALDIDPDFFEGKVNLGFALALKGDYKGAIKFFEEAEVINSENLLLYHYWSLVLSIQGQDEASFYKILKVLTLDPKNSEAHISLAMFFEKKGQIDNAIKEINKAMETKTLNYVDIHHLAVLYHYNGEYDNADKYLNKLIDMDSTNPKAWYNKGINFEEMGNYEEAEICFNKAVEVNPNDDFSWLNKGSFLGRKGNPEKALECFNRVLEINPNCAEAFYHKALTLNELEKEDESLKCLNKALKLKPHLSAAWLRKGILMGIFGKPIKAIECFNEVLELTPQNCDALVLKGGSLYELKKYSESLKFVDKGINCLNKSLKAIPNDKKYLEIKHRALIMRSNIKGSHFRVQEDYKRALKHFNKTLKIDPKDLDALLNKGLCLIYLEKYKKAELYLNKVLKIDQENVLALSLKGYCFNLQGKNQNANDCINKALTINPNDESLIEIMKLIN